MPEQPQEARSAASNDNERRGHALHMQDDGTGRVLPMSPRQEEVKSAAQGRADPAYRRCDAAYVSELGEPIRSALVAAYDSAAISHPRLMSAIAALEGLKDEAVRTDALERELAYANTFVELYKQTVTKTAISPITKKEPRDVGAPGATT